MNGIVVPSDHYPKNLVAFVADYPPASNAKNVENCDSTTKTCRPLRKERLDPRLPWMNGFELEFSVPLSGCQINLLSKISG